MTGQGLFLSKAAVSCQRERWLDQQSSQHRPFYQPEVIWSNLAGPVETPYFLPYLALLCSPMDGMASIIIIFTTWRCEITQFSRVRLHFLSTYHLMPRGRKITFEYCHCFAFADSGNQTGAACATSKLPIHYTIASRQLKLQISSG